VAWKEVKSMREGGRPDCYICRKQDGAEDPPPGGYFHRGRHMLVCHAPLDMGTSGTILIESKRHFLDYGDMSPGEGRELNSLLRLLLPAVKEATGAERVYCFCTMAGAPHFHYWLVPWRKGERLKGVGYLASRMKSPSKAEAENTVKKIRRGLEQK
jgi:diadenosine tetraphosphate (Ap4A) HIT family hydrolase